MPYYISPPPQNPLTRIITAVIAAIMLVGAFMIGMVAFLVIAGLALIAGIAIWLRVAWIKHRLRKNGAGPGVKVPNQRQPGNIIDAEYTVISDKKDRQEN